MAEMKTLTINDVRYDITDANAIKFIEQDLTEEQKAQARENIGALGSIELTDAVDDALAQAKQSGEFDGRDGTSVTVKSVSESTASGGSNVVTFSDNKTITIKNGKDGKTPENGVDYNTPADQEAIVQQVILALGTPVFGTVDADKNIILTGNLADGTYTIKYEDAEGNMTVIGTLEQGASYKNLADPTSADWLAGYRMSSSGEIKSDSVTHLTNYIPVKAGDVVRIRGMNVFFYGSGSDYATQTFYNSDKERIATVTPAKKSTDFGISGGNMPDSTIDRVYTVATSATYISGDASQIAYVRFSSRLWEGYTPEDVIITVNQEITD